MTKKYRKLPVTIEAVQFKVVESVPLKHGVHEEYNVDEVINFAGIGGQVIRIATVPNGTSKGRTYMEIPTLEGIMEANVGDYIIRGVQGEIYPCKPEIFEQTYEEVREDE